MTIKGKLQYAIAEAERLWGQTPKGIQLRSIEDELRRGLSIREAVDHEFAPNGAMPREC